MDSVSNKVKALGLCSGGLDSLLSALVLRGQGIETSWITFETPFFSAVNARKAADQLDIPLTVQNITDTYLPMLKNPPAGYGKNMNPCMDCHTLMFKLAGQYMKQQGFDFLFSGEVLGQRPMSQNRAALRYVEKHSGLEGFIVRPLSARCLPETMPEMDGRVDRDRLLDITGRSRKVQMKLAEKLGILEYPSPAGGCLLTDKGFSDRLRDLFAHQSEPTENELHLLKHGRHLRLTAEAKAVVGRTKQDNWDIEQYVNKERDTILQVADFPGPTVLVPGGGAKETLLLAAAICAGYSKAPGDLPAQVKILSPLSQETVQVLPIPPTMAKRFLV